MKGATAGARRRGGSVVAEGTHRPPTAEAYINITRRRVPRWDAPVWPPLQRITDGGEVVIVLAAYRVQP